MPPTYKDLGKEPSDLLSKFYQAPGSYKLESKFKGPDATVFINPQFNKQSSVDIEYNVKAYNLKTKFNFAADQTIAPKVTFDAAPNKLEVDVAKSSATYDFASGPVTATVSATLGSAAVVDPKSGKATGGSDTVVDAAATYECCKPATVGAKVAYNVSKGALAGWAAGFRYKHDKFLVAITTAQLATYTTGLQAPLNLGFLDATVAVQATCGAGKAEWEVGTDFPCPIIAGNTMRVKVNQNLNVSLAVIRKFADNWKGALTFTSATGAKFGAYVVRE